jgi:predicted nucleic acid-binding protein
MITHVLDTSAWLAHLFQEPGYEQVSELLLEPDNRIGVSVLSLIEVYGRMRHLNIHKRFENVVAQYRDVFAQIIPVSEAIALRAVALREAAAARVPAIDALIAATAAHHNAALIHRDPHLAALPGEAVVQVVIGREE